MRSKKAQLTFIAAFSLLLWGSALYFVEMFPFSHFPMFSDDIRKYSKVEIVNSKGKVINPKKFSLQINYEGMPETLFKTIKYPKTYNLFGTFLTNEQVKQAVSESKYIYDGPLDIRIFFFSSVEGEFRQVGVNEFKID